jgi:arylsulfatase A-like enzyme
MIHEGARSDTTGHRRPNFLLILSDQLRADALGCYGNAIVQTPNLDRLAQSGVVYEQCIVTQPTCTPSRASILTGCYPSALRTRMVGCRTPDDPRFVTHALAQAGYHTASIGKIHLRPQAEEPAAIAATRDADGIYNYYGFQEIELVNGHGDKCFGPSYTPWLEAQMTGAIRAEQRQPRRYAHGTQDTYAYDLPLAVHPTTYIGDRAVDFLKRTGDEPFFLHVSFPDPHQPFCVPEPYADMYRAEEMPPPLPPLDIATLPPWYGEAYTGKGSPCVLDPPGARVDRVTGTKPDNYQRYTVADFQQTKAIYYGMISLLDDAIGRILHTLHETGLDRNTVVLFMADHGEYLGDYGLTGKGLLFDCALRVPLLIAGPHIQGGRRMADIASTVDIAPTLLDLANVSEPEGVQGLSMGPQLIGNRTPVRQGAITENDDDFVPMRARALTTNDWKIVRYGGTPLGELYDRLADPDEQHNLWNNPVYKEIQANLTGYLLDELLCSFDSSNGRVQIPRPVSAKWVPLDK